MGKNTSGLQSSEPFQVNNDNEIYTLPVYKRIITYPLSKDELSVLLNNKTIIDTWGVSIAILSLATSISYYFTKPNYNENIFWASILLWIITILVYLIGDKFDTGDKKKKINEIKDFFNNIKDK